MNSTGMASKNRIISDASRTSKDRTEIQPVSTLSQSRRSVDIPKRRSQSASPPRAPANISSDISKDRSTNDLYSSNQFNPTAIGIKISTDPSAKEETPPRSRPNVSDSTFDEYHSHGNTQNISS